MISVFTEAMGKLLAENDTLNSVALPARLNTSIAEGIVRSANQERKQVPPYAILVSSETEDKNDPGCLKLNEKTAIGYRHGNRLAVVVGNSSALQSFTRTFRNVLPVGFPSEFNERVDLDLLSKKISEVIYSRLGIIDSKFLDKNETSSRLESAMYFLAELYKKMCDGGGKDWNVFWYEHVDKSVDALLETIQFQQKQNPLADLNSCFEDLTYASFGLPKPDKDYEYKNFRSSAVRDFQDSFEKWWSSEDQIKETADFLNSHPDVKSSKHPIDEIDWSGFDQSQLAHDNLLTAWAEYCQANAKSILAFSELSEKQFLNPLSQIQAAGQILIFSNDEVERTLIAGSAGPYFAETAFSDLEEDWLTSEVLELHIPLLVNNLGDSVDENYPDIVVADKRFKWISSGIKTSSDKLILIGKFEGSIGKAPYKNLFKQIQISINCPAPLAGKIDSTARSSIYLIPPLSNGLAVFKLTNKTKISSGTYVGPDTNSQEELEAFTYTLPDTSSKFYIVTWAEEASLEGKSLEIFADTSRIRVAAISPSPAINLVLDNTEYLLRAQSASAAVQSPVIAAIHNEALTDDAPSIENSHSIRGLLEDALSTNVTNDDWLSALGHIVLPQDRHESIQKLSLSPDKSLIIGETTYAAWSAISDFQVDEEFLKSAEVNQFQDAFKALGLDIALTERASGGNTNRDWPSRTSWRHLLSGDRTLLNTYLDTYSQLVAAARKTGLPNNIFWATYPFSVSIWNTTNEGDCQAVLLSPFHPIRLAWLASIENALFESEIAESLAGTIEGWNLPFIGPSTSLNGAMVAVPLDSGKDQLFLGWSMLVRASVDGQKPLESPSRIADLPAPGSASSGMNSSSAEGALRSYRRINPHVTTLSVDLAALKPTSRLSEIDDAILNAASEWSKSAEKSLVGGVRVWDSLYRQGDPPLGQIAKMTDENSTIPAAWIRYEFDPLKTKKCNIRLLQDSGVKVSVNTMGNSNLGVMGSVPLRRFEAQTRNSGENKFADISPTLKPGIGWDSFNSALREFENSNAQPMIRAQLFKTLLIDENADWTVSGEALVSPSSIAELLDPNNKATQMLWEWRPPFLDSKPGTTFLERRPFLSVARIPTSFKKQLFEILQKANPHGDNQVRVNQLISMLGSKGVGLSSLLSMGGTHASGALGFYLAFALMDRVVVENTNLFVLPLDACDSFLRALTGTRLPENLTKRADLLALQLSDSEIKLTPIEIKLYGLGSDMPPTSLPKHGDHELKEGLQQLEETTTLLRAVRKKSKELQIAESNESDKALWFNALATLIEAASKLSPVDVQNGDLLQSRLESIIEGRLNVEVGKPLLTYFAHNSQNENTRSHHLIKEENYAGLIANVGQTFQATSSDIETSSLLDDWRELISWTLSSTSELDDDIPSIASQKANQEKDVVSTAVDLLEKSDESASEIVEVEIPATPVDTNHKKEKAGDEHSAEFVPDSGSENNKESDISLNNKESSAKPVPKRTNTWPDFETSGIKFDVGESLNTVKSTNLTFWPGNTMLSHMNIGVVGDLGTGKTQLLKSLIAKTRASSEESQDSPTSFLIFDYKRDYQDDKFVEKVGGKVLKPINIPINFFKLDVPYSNIAAYQRAQSFCNVIEKIYSGVGPVQENVLIETIMELYGDGSGPAPTMKSVLNAYKAARNGVPDSVISILNRFVLPGIFSENQEETVSFSELLEDQVLIIALSDLGADTNTKNALVVLFLDLYYDNMLHSMTKWPFKGELPDQIRKINSFLLVDEATNIMSYNFPVLMMLLLQGREFGVGVILASQYLKHFKTAEQNYGEPLLTWFIHKVPNVTQVELASLGLGQAPPNTASKISTLVPHEAFYSSYGNDGVFMRGQPFFEYLQEIE